MTMYVTKKWAFVSAAWPLVAFSRRGIRDRLLANWKEGDTMLFVSTQTSSFVENRGRIMGYVEMRPEAVETMRLAIPVQGIGDGSKWPFALPATRAWRFVEPPLFKEFLPRINARYPGRMLAGNYGLLDPDEEAEVRTLAVEPVDIIGGKNT